VSPHTVNAARLRIQLLLLLLLLRRWGTPLIASTSCSGAELHLVSDSSFARWPGGPERRAGLASSTIRRPGRILRASRVDRTTDSVRFL
jgi:hypothetical protein